MVHREFGVANMVNVWHGLLPGATHADPCTSALWFDRCVIVDAYPASLLAPVPAERPAAPFSTRNVISTFACGTPCLSTRTDSGTSSVAPYAIHFVGSTAARSSGVVVPTTVACLLCGGLYEAGASAAVMVLVPVAVGVTPVDAIPASSVSTEQLEAPAQVESVAPFVVDHAIVAPATAVTPSAATARTRIGFAASAPTGV